MLQPLRSDVKLNGYGSRLTTVISSALGAVVKGDIKNLVANMFPASELRRPDADKRLARLVARFKNNKVVIRQMYDDLKDALHGKPTYEDSGNVAVFQIPARTVRVGRSTAKVPARMIKFQKVENSWRFYDHSARIRSEIARQLTLKPTVARSSSGRAIPVGRYVSLEKFGSSWRLGKMSKN